MEDPGRRDRKWANDVVGFYFVLLILKSSDYEEYVGSSAKASYHFLFVNRCRKIE